MDIQEPSAVPSCSHFNTETGEVCGKEASHLTFLGQANETTGGTEHIEKSGVGVVCPEHAENFARKTGMLLHLAATSHPADTENLAGMPVATLRLAKSVIMPIPKNSDGSVDLPSFGSSVLNKGLSADKALEFAKVLQQNSELGPREQVRQASARLRGITLRGTAASPQEQTHNLYNNSVEHFYAAQREHRNTPPPSITGSLTDDELHTTDLERKELGLGAAPRYRTPGRPAEGISDKNTVRVTTRSIERALPWNRDQDSSLPRYLDIDPETGAAARDKTTGELKPTGRPITARRSEFDPETGERLIAEPQITKVIGPERVNKSVISPLFGQQFPSEDIAPHPYEPAPIRRRFTPEHAPRRLYEGNRAYELQHPIVLHPQASTPTPVTWFNGKAVHVARVQKDTGGTVWLPNVDHPAVMHTAGCKNKDHRGTCSDGCTPLSFEDLYGAETYTAQGERVGRRSTFRHHQEVNSRRNQADKARALAEARTRRDRAGEDNG